VECSRHPEYRAYVRDLEHSQRCRQAVEAWRASGEPVVAGQYALCWTFERAQGFVGALGRLFRAYNAVLWERFPYCSRCFGGCCVLSATHVGTFDVLALAMLGAPYPALPQRIRAGAWDCIYLAARGCAWPAAWRPIKCWAFYCALGEPAGDLVAQLRQVVRDLMPGALRAYEEVEHTALLDRLEDPVVFAGALKEALVDVFVAPLGEHYPAIAQSTPDGRAVHSPEDLRADLLAVLGEIAQQACAASWPVPRGSEAADTQLLADLETLEWIVVGHPQDGAERLCEMGGRYASARPPRDGEPATVCYRMRCQVSRLQELYGDLQAEGDTEWES
jgi:hypothetical protein